VWNVEGKFERNIVLPCCPYGVALVTAGGMGGKLRAVVSGNDNRVYVIDALTGQQLNSFGGSGSGREQLSYPYSLAVRNGELWVIDRGNHRLTVFK